MQMQAGWSSPGAGDKLVQHSCTFHRAGHMSIICAQLNLLSGLFGGISINYLEKFMGVMPPCSGFSLCNNIKKQILAGLEGQFFVSPSK